MQSYLNEKLNRDLNSACQVAHNLQDSGSKNKCRCRASKFEEIVGQTTKLAYNSAAQTAGRPKAIF